MKKYITLFFVGAFLISCAPSQQKSAVVHSQEDAVDGGFVKPSVIYGTDGRLDFFNETDLVWKIRASSTVALMSSSSLSVSATGYDVRGINYGTSQGLCKNEPFYEQDTAAFCSGSLIAPDVIMTAGHCARTLARCQDTKFVFGFAYKAAGVAPKSMGFDDVYSCKDLIHSEVTNSNSNDFALIRLDRPVVGHSPLPVRQKGRIAVGDELTVIGHPSGLPTKIAGGATVRDTTPAKYFVTNLDTYGGNSGSAVFNSQTGLIEGILVRGATDFVYKNGCYISNVCKEDGCRGEDVTRVAEIFDYIDVKELVPVEEPETEVLEAPVEVSVN